MNKEQINKYFNLSLYQEGTEITQEFIFRDEIIEYIIEKMEFSGDSGYNEGYTSMNYYEPDEPDSAFLEINGKLQLSVIEKKFGRFKEGDIEALNNELENNDKFEELLKTILRDFKSSQISEFSIGNKKITIDKKQIIVEVEADDIELI